ncbi:MAG: YbaB/EbfC family nucleoid-associated protein [Cytophagales bacterium]|nr:YbaB/EbfC family nucleoid-associated protein [Cytophagales bacterium]
MFDMNNIMGKVQEAQANLQKAQAELVNETTSAESGAGMVKVTVNGHRQLIDLEIDPALLKKEDQEMVQDLVIAATNKAMEQIEVQIKEKLRESTNGLIPNIPGMNFGF